jgi:bifunctional non-homologous end joining protein LigD
VRVHSQQRLEALLALIAGGAIELHAWNSTTDDVEHPDRIVFDLDPGPHVSWREVVDAAHHLRAQLKAVGLESWPKSTGGKGLHVTVPFERGPGWDEAYAFSRAFAEAVAARDARFTTSFSKSDRGRRILVDYKRNYRASIAIAAFSVRARPHAPVAVPLSWSEVTAAQAPDAWTVHTLPPRLARLKRDPWERCFSHTQRLPSLAAAGAPARSFGPRARKGQR